MITVTPTQPLIIAPSVGISEFHKLLETIEPEPPGDEAPLYFGVYFGPNFFGQFFG